MGTDQRTSVPAVGRGTAFAHHGEVLQGIFRNTGREGWLPGLVTMPLDRVGARATFVPRRYPLVYPVSARSLPRQVPRDGTGTARVEVSPPSCLKARRAAELTVDHLCRTRGLRLTGGTLRITGLVPVGLGMGSSTADVVAAIRAVCDAVGAALGAQEIAHLSVEAEQASDPPSANDETLLFAQHSGDTLERLGPVLPRMWLLSCRTCHSQPVDTLALAARRGGNRDLDHFEHLRGQLRHALRHHDIAAIGAVATASAELNQRRLVKPELPTIISICRDTGGAGVQIAHSGNIASIMYDPRTASGENAAAIAESRRMLTRHGIPVTGVLRVGCGHQPARPSPRQEQENQ